MYISIYIYIIIHKWILLDFLDMFFVRLSCEIAWAFLSKSPPEAAAVEPSRGVQLSSFRARNASWGPPVVDQFGKMWIAMPCY